MSGANLQRPAWSPDGEQLSFEANFHDEKRIELYVGDPEPGGFDEVKATRRSASALTEGFQRSGGGQVVHELAWAPAKLGSMYVFAASNDSFDYDLYISGGTALAPAPAADGGAAWSPDGGAIAFTSARTGEGDLYIIYTNAVEKPPERLTTLSDSSELYVQWSPDGRALVFVAHTEAGDNLWLLPAIGAPPTRLTSWPGNQIRPRFAPSGGQLAFYANHEDPQRFDLYVMSVGVVPTLLVAGVYPDARGPSWTPDGKHIVYVADDDSAFDPVRAVRVDDPARIVTLDLGTVGHADLDVANHAGQPYVAVVAQGRKDDAVRDFKRLFLAPLPALQ